MQSWLVSIQRQPNLMTQRFVGEDPRNDEDYDSWEAAMEPIPGDHSWTKEKAPEGPVDQMEVTNR
jgi:hypothetical protein